jgi:hypothetical protein
MFRRIVLALAFVATLGVAGFGASNRAEAHGGGCYRGGYGGGYGAYYAPYGYGGYGYGPPRAAYYRGYNPYYSGYGGYGGYPRHHHDSGVSISFGF